jgi:hypothetical protein
MRPATERAALANGDQPVDVVTLCWKNDGGVFVPNERPIHLQLESPNLSLEMARQLIGRLTDAVQRVEEVRCILEAEAGTHP